MRIEIGNLSDRDKKERKAHPFKLSTVVFKNMKIEINEDQPLDEVVRELERLMYKQVGVSYIFRGKTFICTNSNGYYVCLKKSASYCKITTLTELKVMTND